MEKTTINGYEVEALNRKAQVSLKNTDPFIKRVKSLKDEGHSEKEVATMLGTTVVGLRKEISRRLRDERNRLAKEAAKLREAGESTNAIALKLGIKESSVKLLLETEK